VVRFLYSVTEPVLRPIRRRLPVFFGGLDLSPLVVLLIIIFLQHVVVDNLRQIAVRM
jgi:YggT family protein